MRRNAVFKCIQQEAKLIISAFFGKAKDFKHLLLDIILMDSDTAATDLGTVKNDIVGFGADASRIGIDILEVLFHGHGEWMVHGLITVLLI